MVSFEDRIPKKSRKDAKHCTLCRKHGGAQNTHNTGNCKKYNSDGAPKKGFAERSPQNGNSQHDKKTNYVQLSAKIAKLEKSNKKLKHANKKHKRDHDSDSDDSDSS